jgi:trypsin-like peptidase
LSHSAAQEASPHPARIAADLDEVVVPITSFKIAPSIKTSFRGKPGPALGFEAAFGTGFCLDEACRFIVSNYHVAVVARPRSIKRQKVVQRYMATGPKDKEATLNDFPNEGPLAFAKKRDLAIFELQRPLNHHHGLTFSLDELEPGQAVDIYGYPKTGVSPQRKLTRFAATFKAPTTSGLLAFEYESSGGKSVHTAGASGGIVLDRKTQAIVGVLCGTTETLALAVPAQTLAEFVNKVQPFLGQKLFPPAGDVPPISADLYPKFSPLSDFNEQLVPRQTEGLQHRHHESNEIVMLRDKAQVLLESMRDYIAVQSYAWGSGNSEPEKEAAYEVRVIDGVQRFRRYPDGKSELQNASYPSLHGWVAPADQWSRLPDMVAKEYGLKVHQAADAVLGSRRLKVFQYYASAEDSLCPFEPVEDFGLFVIGKTVAVPCYGEVWTDQDTNIIRISLFLDLSRKLKEYRGWEDFHVIVTYDRVDIDKEFQPLVPRTIYTEAHDKKHVYWCRGQFTDYQKFGVRSKLLSGELNP